MYYLFFDTETTGVPKNYQAPITDLLNWPRMIELGFLVFNEQGEETFRYEAIIKPVGFTIPEEASRIHGISTERALAEGIPLIDALTTFSEHMLACEIISAHNLSFDEKIIGAEYLRANLSEAPTKFAQKKQICTMKASTEYCKIPGRYGSFKWPNLQELHTKLFGVKFEGAHGALADIQAAARSFFELKRLGVIKTEEFSFGKK